MKNQTQTKHLKKKNLYSKKASKSHDLSHEIKIKP
jgi:hypothetical protein